MPKTHKPCPVLYLFLFFVSVCVFVCVRVPVQALWWVHALCCRVPTLMERTSTSSWPHSRWMSLQVSGIHSLQQLPSCWHARDQVGSVSLAMKCCTPWVWCHLQVLLPVPASPGSACSSCPPRLLSVERCNLYCLYNISVLPVWHQLYRLYRITCTACIPLPVLPVSTGVPTVWLNLLHHMSKHNLKLRHLRRVCIAGSAPPRSMIEALEG